ncbi:MAG TPA: MgtC/SapB family protein [Candidatus Paceibacterota bacterium]|nr:MgtC/SapB family protein [Verrucomicrobiota bacterium]HRY51962.1 MgtC/SapB family protein [Candidatus Paceibacterota bacterium]
MYSLRGDLPSPWLEIVLVLVAILSGGIVGSERERLDKPAGLRTLILVCLGSTVFTIVSYAFTTTTGDAGRVAAQIVTGVGFLGAGAILHSRNTVSGMTTAAAIWMMAAVGITIGTGRPGAGLGLALLVRGVLAGVRRWEIRHLGGVTSVAVEVVFDPDHGKTQIRLDSVRELFRVSQRFEVQTMPGQETLSGRLDVRLPRRHLHEFLSALVDMPAVREIREVPPGNP